MNRSRQTLLSGGETVRPNELFVVQAKIELPKQADDQRLILHLRRSTGCVCALCGKLVGMHTWRMPAAAFDVTDFATAGERLRVMRVRLR